MYMYCRLEGVPIVSGKANISYHAHFGPVRMFLTLNTSVAQVRYKTIYVHLNFSETTGSVHLYCTVLS